MANGKWLMVDGPWFMINGLWFIVQGSWLMVVKYLWFMAYHFQLMVDG
jgi:hypothetical protein